MVNESNIQEAGAPATEAPVEQALNQGTETVATPPAAEDLAAVQDPLALLEAVTADRDRLAAEKAELQETMLRRQADFENYRKRVERERVETAEYAGMAYMEALLPVLDDMERALQHAPAADGPAADYIKGMELIYQRLVDTLRKLGLEPLESAGKIFDPALHHAVQRQESADCADQTILEEYQKGYNFKGRLLRPAMVKVAVKS